MEPGTDLEQFTNFMQQCWNSQDHQSSLRKIPVVDVNCRSSDLSLFDPDDHPSYPPPGPAQNCFVKTKGLMVRA